MMPTPMNMDGPRMLWSMMRMPVMYIGEDSPNASNDTQVVNCVSPTQCESAAGVLALLAASSAWARVDNDKLQPNPNHPSATVASLG